MSKKIITILLTALMVLTMSQGVSAATLTTDGQTADVPVKYTAKTTAFSVTIPAALAPDGAKAKTFSISSAKMNLRPDEHIEVSISQGVDTNSAVTLLRQNVPAGKTVATLLTTLSVKGDVLSKNNNVVGYFADSATPTTNTIGAVTMSALNYNATTTEAGDYLGTVTFKISLIQD